MSAAAPAKRSRATAEPRLVPLAERGGRNLQRMSGLSGCPGGGTPRRWRTKAQIPAASKIA